MWYDYMTVYRTLGGAFYGIKNIFSGVNYEL